MDKVKIILENGVEKEVDGVFYLFNSKYYLMYTEKEIDQNGYVVLHLVQVGKEVVNTPTGPVETGYMIGAEILNQDEWGEVQKSITKIVDDMKNKTQNESIQYLSMNMLSTLKIVSKKTFRLMRSIIEEDFKVDLSTTAQSTNSTSSAIEPKMEMSSNQNKIPDQSTSHSYESQPINSGYTDNDVIIDYRSSFFEEQEKNIALQATVDELTAKLENIKQIIG